MKTYKTYQEAKIDNPKSEIYTNGNVFAVIEKFGVGAFDKCKPEDYCMTVEQFLKDGHKFVDGDVGISVEGKVVVIGHGLCTAAMFNEKCQNDSDRYVLRAAALEGLEAIEKVEWAIVSEVEWKYGDECIYKDDRCLFIGALPVKGAPINGNCIVQHEGGAPLVAYAADLFKPESPEAKEKRERLEAIDEITEFLNNLSPACKNKMEYVARAIVDKTNYRKS